MCQIRTRYSHVGSEARVARGKAIICNKVIHL